MQEKISLSKFTKATKNELRSSVDEDEPFFYLDRVDLEVTFGLELEANAGVKLFVFDAHAKAQGTQTHKVTLSLTPFLSSRKVHTFADKRQVSSNYLNVVEVDQIM